MINYLKPKCYFKDILNNLYIESFFLKKMNLRSVSIIMHIICRRKGMGPN